MPTTSANVELARRGFQAVLAGDLGPRLAGKRSGERVMASPRIELLLVPDCPLGDRVRATVLECLSDTATAAAVQEREGEYPSPTLLIDGLDVTTGRPAASGACCRLDLPTRAQILGALARTRA